MLLLNDIITKEQIHKGFASSYEGKYLIMDNLDEKDDPIIRAHDEYYNTEYIYSIVVLRGVLHLTVAGTDINLKANEYLNITPCMGIAFKESHCAFFTFMTRSYLTADIYERTHVSKRLHFQAFKFRHLKLTPELKDILFECYLRVKSEHLREDYPMKEVVLRAYQGAYISKLFSFTDTMEVVQYAKNTRHYKLFSEFINKLDAKHREERSVQYYAQAMNITPKYLSTIVLTYTGLTASQVIDQYVAYSIKQSLYTNEHNIKVISAEFNFPSQSFFGRYFKRITGYSPNEYIKQHNIKSINFKQSNQLEN